MSRSREAIPAIKGYYYQLDYFILKILSSKNKTEVITLEGIEDVDVNVDGNIEAIQCKYYEGTRCSPSIIGKAVRPMLSHFSENRNHLAHYKVYGYYKSGQNSIPPSEDISADYAKDNFFTFTEGGKKRAFHKELNLSDSDIEDFLSCLTIDVNAYEYSAQVEQIIKSLKKEFGCSEFESKYFYYCNALFQVKELARGSDRGARTISKENFLNLINKKQVIFDRWYFEYIGYKSYYREVKRKYFVQKYNTSPFERFFLIECDDNVSNEELAELIHKISNNWSKLSKREHQCFCPYIYFESLSGERLVAVKQLLLNNNIHIWDGHEFLGSAFSVQSILRSINASVDIKAKIINTKSEVDEVISACSGKTRVVYQFYMQSPFYEGRNDAITNANICIQYTLDVLNMV